MLSKPYRHGNNWRIDVNENNRKYYIEFASYEEAWDYYENN